MTALFLISFAFLVSGLSVLAQISTATATVSTNANGSLSVIVSAPGKPKTLKLSWDASPTPAMHLGGYVVRTTGPGRADKSYRGLGVYDRTMYVSNIVSGTYVFTVRAYNHFGVESDPITATYTAPAGPAFRLNITTENLQ